MISQRRIGASASRATFRLAIALYRSVQARSIVTAMIICLDGGSDAAYQGLANNLKGRNMRIKHIVIATTPAGVVTKLRFGDYRHARMRLPSER